MKYFALTLYVILWAIGLNGQTCGAGGINLTTQAQVDSFPIKYPACSEIIGDVTINGADINNLTALSSVHSIDGNLMFWYSNLTSFTGLENLSSVGGLLKIYNNYYLTDLNGLSSLSSIGHELIIDNNALLTDLNGLNSLTSVGGSITINSNNNLLNLSGLNGLSTIHDLQITNNQSLLNFTGLNSVSSINGNIDIENNSELVDFNGLNNLNTINGNISISYNPSVSSLTGFESLNSIIGDFNFEQNNGILNFQGFNTLNVLTGNLNISANYSLNSLAGLNAISTTAGNIIIAENGLQSITGLTQLSSIGNLTISDCSSLMDISGLNSLTTVISGLTLNNIGIGNLSALSSLNNINGSFTISNCNSITDLQGVSSLNSIGLNLDIHNNNNIANLTGLSGLNSIGGSLYLVSNSSLINLNGLSSLNSIEDTFLIQNNNSLTNFDGAEQLTTVTGNLIIEENNSLLNLSGLEVITSIGLNLDINNNNQLTQISGINSLNTIGGKLSINHNPALSDLTGFTGLNNINSDLYIKENSALVNLEGLNHSINIIGNLIIQNNELLSNCAVESICNYLANPPNGIDIQDNSSACNYPEIYTHCSLPIPDCPPNSNLVLSTQAQVDNFPINSPNCTQFPGNLTVTGTGITNLNGLSSLTAINGFLHISNTEIANFSGLNSLNNIGGELLIDNNFYIDNLTGLAALTTIGGQLNIYYNYYMSSLTGLEELTSVGGRLYISSNYQLSSLNALSSLTNIGTELSIYSNSALHTLNGLENINLSNVTSLNLVGDSYLSVCDLPNICDYVANQSNSINVGGNYTGCETRQEIENTCAGCPPAGMDFYSQIEIDSFPFHYPGCSTIIGSISIQGSDITNLNGLAQITSITGDLIIVGNNPLSDLSGLNNLTSVGGEMDIEYNTGLTNLSDFAGLINVNGDIHIYSNIGMNLISGLNSLTSIGGSLYIQQNEGLITINGFNALNIVSGGINFYNNPELLAISGLSSINTIGGDLSFYQNISLVGLPVFSGSASVGGNLDIEFNQDLTSLSGPGGITSIGGYLYIDNNKALNNLTGLNLLTSVGNYFYISNTALTSLPEFDLLNTIGSYIAISNNNSLTNISGFNYLTSLSGGLYIGNDTIIESITGFSNLNSIGVDLYIDYTPLLNNISGLNSLTSINGYLSIYNTSLTSLSGFSGLNSIGYLTLKDNYQLLSLNGLNGLSIIPGDLFLTGNTILSNLTGLESITAIGNAYLFSNGFTSFTGLNSLTTVTGNFSSYYNNMLPNFNGMENVTSIGELSMGSNEILENLTGLNGLTSVGAIQIESNPVLTSLSGIDNIDYTSISGLTIIYSDSLSNCSVQSICNYINSPNNSTSIYDNALGCNSILEVITKCAGCPVGDLFFATQAEIDAFPSLYQAGCTTITGNVTIQGSDITNLDSLAQLKTIGGFLLISGNENLNNLNGLNALSSIGDSLIIENNAGLVNLTGLNSLNQIANLLKIESNNSMTSLTGLNSLDTIYGYLIIKDNASLVSLSGIDSINYKTIYSLTIQNSNMLSTCNVKSICNYLEYSSNPADISNNTVGCNNTGQVQMACGIPVTCPNSISFSTQSQIDDFPIDFPGCTLIPGNVNIHGSGITNLNGLVQLNVIGGELNIYNNSNLESLAGLNNLTFIGVNLYLEANPLPDLEGLNAVTYLGGLKIQSNTALNSLSGLNTLTHISSKLLINENDNLSSLTGLNSVDFIGDKVEISNENFLTDLTGLNSLEYVGGEFLLHNCEGLENLSGLNSLNTIGGGLFIADNSNLINLNGLNSLYNISNKFYLNNNTQLNSISSLSTLQYIYGSIEIENNNSLTSLAGLDNVYYLILTNLIIQSSNSLSTCNVNSICNYLSIPNSIYTISGNAVGCNNQPEIIAACCNMTATATSTPPSVCQGNSAQLYLDFNGGIYPFSYNWSPGSTLNDSTIYYPIATPDSTTTYSVTVTDINGCSTSTTVTVSVNTNIASISSNSPVCLDATINLYASGGAYYYWYGPDGFYSYDQNPQIFNATPSNEGLYTVMVTDLNGCTGTASTYVTVQQNIQVNPVPNMNYCPLQIVPTISFSSPNSGISYSWTRTNEPIGLVPLSGVGNIQAFFASNTGTVALTATFTVTPSFTNNGVTCTGQSIQFTITVSSSAVANCKNATIILDGNGQANLTPADIDNGSTGGILSISKSSFNCSNLGVNTVVLSVTDAICNNISTCTAIVTVVDYTPPVMSNVVSLINIQCDQLIPAVPVVTATDNCSAIISFTQSSSQSPFLQLCEHYSYSITRTWIATDPSGNTAKKEQSINIIDNKAPIWAFVPPPFLTVECSEANSNNADPIPVDACDQSPSILLDIKYQFGIYNCVNNYLATYTWTAGDKCGNTLKYVQQIAVVDTTAPEIYCPSNIVITSQVPIVVNWEEPIVSDNCGVPPNTIEISGPLSGSLFQPNTVTTIIYQSTDNCSNVKTCSFTVTINSQGGGGSNKSKISGTIINKKGISIQNVGVTLSGSVNQFFNANGQYSFINLTKGSNLTVTPIKKDNPLNGVNTLDIIYITNHILGKKALDSPYKLIAADVNNSKNVTTADVVKVKKLILHVIDKFDNVDSWQFLPSNTVFQNPLNPWLNNFTGSISINNIQSDQSANFTAIKMGDVTWDAIGTANGNLEVKENNTYSLQAEDKSFKRDEELELIIGGKELNSLKAMQFTLEYNPDKLEYVGIKSERDDISEEDFGTRYIEGGKITGSIILRDEKGGDKLFSVILKAKEPGSLLSSISLTSNLTTAEAYTKEDETNSLKLVFTKDGKEETLSTAVLYQNEPNPFENSTVIRFYIPDNQEAILSLYTTAGTVIKETREIYSKGEHQLTVPKEEFPSSGIYYYQLKTNNFIDTKKMMFIK